MKNATHKQFIQWYKEYQNSQEKYLWQVYDKCSQAKINSYNKIVERYQHNYKFYNIYILGHNSSHYVTGSICETENEDFFIVETFRNTYICGYNNGELYSLITGEVFYEG